MGVREAARAHPVAAFVALTLCLSWPPWTVTVALGRSVRVLGILGAFGPTLAALALTAAVSGRAGLRRLVGRALRWRIAPRWYAFALGAPVVVLTARTAAAALWSSIPPVPPVDPIFAVLAFGYVLLFSVAGEELGWRGYLLPRLQAGHGAVVSSLALGAVWFGWHLPLFLVPESPQTGIPLSLYAAQILASSVLYTWLVNNTDGSLVLPHLFHAASNAVLGFVPVLPVQSGGDVRALTVAVVLLWVVAATVVAVEGHERLTDGQRPEEAVTPP